MDSALIDQTSELFLGQWKRLVSTTNWEKGKIIHEWREALHQRGTPGAEYSDEAWSRRVGNVTPQHVGRLRRAYERFGSAYDSYEGLYWSHFQAALDWDDAEMYLEGAVQNGWSVSQMRQQRWEAQGGTTERPEDAEAAATEWDEDADSDGAAETMTGTLDTVQSPETGSSAGVDEDDDEHDRSEFDDGEDDSESPFDAKAADEATEVVRPFASLPPLPADVNDAFESYKLCILRHKLAGWQEISQSDLLSSLDALKQLALMPADA